MSDLPEKLLVAVGDIKEDIGGLRADVAHHTKRMDEVLVALSHISERNEKLAGRVTKLEHANTRIKTLATVLGAAASAVLTVALAVFKGIAWPHA